MSPSTSLPQHIAIIMDGNGRWAQARGCGRSRGHREGVRRVDEIVTECCELGVRYLTLYAFSTENWHRPFSEVNMLMRLLVHYLRSYDKKLIRNQIRLVAQGALHRLPRFVQAELRRVRRVTETNNPKCYLNLSLSYGGRQEIVDAARSLAEKVRKGELSPDDIDEHSFRAQLYRPDFPDPDLLIRTGGEYRLSNFLLWQLAYTELFVTDRLWPDFRVDALHEALADYSRRQRRFGKTPEQVQAVATPTPMHGLI